MTQQELDDLRRSFLGGDLLRNVANDPEYQRRLAACASNASRQKTATELQNIYNNPELQKLMAEAQKSFMAQMAQAKGDEGVDHAMAVALAKQIAAALPDFSQKGTGLELLRPSDCSGNIEADVHGNGTTTMRLTLVGLSLTDLEMIVEALKPFVKTPITWQNHGEIPRRPGFKPNLQYHAFAGVGPFPNPNP